MYASILCNALREWAKLTRKLVTRYIVGYKKEESDMLLKLLYDHIGFGADFQARVRWQAKTVVVWDVSQVHGEDAQGRVTDIQFAQNRVTCHSAILDFNVSRTTRFIENNANSLQGQRRHLARITPQAERPFETKYIA